MTASGSGCCKDQMRLDCLACQAGMSSVAAYCDSVKPETQNESTESRTESTESRTDSTTESRSESETDQKGAKKSTRAQALCAAVATVHAELYNVGVGSHAWALVQSLDPDNTTLAQVTSALELEVLESVPKRYTSRIDCDWTLQGFKSGSVGETDANPPACTLVLPSADLYAIVAKTVAFDGSEVFAASLVGATPEEWSEYPLDGFPSDARVLFQPEFVRVSQGQGGVAPGTVARVRFNNPFAQLAVLTLIAHGDSEWHQVVPIGEAGKCSLVD
jgi:hypothetical protein